MAVRSGRRGNWNRNWNSDAYMHIKQTAFIRRHILTSNLIVCARCPPCPSPSPSPLPISQRECICMKRHYFDAANNRPKDPNLCCSSSCSCSWSCSCCSFCLCPCSCCKWNKTTRQPARTERKSELITETLL